MILIAAWLAVAAERYLKHSRAKNNREQEFMADAAAQAWEAKRQRDRALAESQIAVAAQGLPPDRPMPPPPGSSP